MFKFVLFLIIFFFIIRFVLRFIMPVIKMTRMTQYQMNEIKKKMEGMQQQGPVNPNQQRKQVDGDYIEYEEVK